MHQDETGRKFFTPLVKLAVLACIIIVGALAAIIIDVPTVAEVRSQVASAGLLGALVFVLVYAALSSIPSPASVLSIASGVLFGFVGGAAVVFVGAMMAATVSYLLGKYLGAEAVVRYGGTRTRRVVHFLRRRGFVAVLLVRLVPLFPFWLVNYAGGISGIKARDYFLGTALGIVPGVLSYVALGAFGTQPLSWPFAAAIAAFVLLTAGGAYYARRMRNAEPELADRV
ncbi:TVP38/TMEM64 family protein [Hoyosella altamirensis]|uniref:TVP38/TMEM64 family membrane protein n=1 Tax=Hoyosella altamirensis TaxID=616997 RepID=A0A839RT49_9ACTN|nr:TVP38/TMEM64 family protein [Hoyosella altamirensis]MBB3039527.1 putative membrane protein YdjX (TVP38/TMEM64 family) [Hoyosella altamirensis]